MKRKEYKKAADAAGFRIHSWLKELPCYANGECVTLTNAVPIVVVPKDTQNKPPAGFVFRWSTLHYVEGYHVDKGFCLRAMVRITPEMEEADA